MKSKPDPSHKNNESNLLIRELRWALRAQADPAKAAAMQAYMKSTMPYYGIQATEQRRIYREIFSQHPLESFESWSHTVLALWRSAQFREERYAALELIGRKCYADFRTLACLPLYEEIIVTGAWWDTVDHVAIHRLGELLRHYPRQMKMEMRTWSRCDDLWKRRSAILCQISFKRDTDQSLLYACIQPALGNREFFLRKAIGWALRQYARVDPHEVIRYVTEKRDELSGLSKREALKHPLRTGLIDALP